MPRSRTASDDAVRPRGRATLRWAKAAPNSGPRCRAGCRGRGRGAPASPSIGATCPRVASRAAGRGAGGSNRPRGGLDERVAGSTGSRRRTRRPPASRREVVRRSLTRVSSSATSSSMAARWRAASAGGASAASDRDDADARERRAQLVGDVGEQLARGPRAAGPGAPPSRRTCGASAPISSRRSSAARAVRSPSPKRRATWPRCSMGRAIARARGAEASASTTTTSERMPRARSSELGVRDAQRTAAGSARVRRRGAHEVPMAGRAVRAVEERRLGRRRAGAARDRPAAREAATVVRVDDEVHVELLRDLAGAGRRARRRAAAPGGRPTWWAEPVRVGARARVAPDEEAGERDQGQDQVSHEEQHAVEVDPAEERAAPQAAHRRSRRSRAGSPRRGPS